MFRLSLICRGLLILIFSALMSSWGFFAHKHINQQAVFSLPEDMLTFYKKSSLYLSEHAVDPDKRRYAVPEEAARHYIDLDHYPELYQNRKPVTYFQALERYSEDSLQAHGTVPWTILLNMKRLEEAFKAEDADRILKYSADLGHYVGDAHVPLHTTSNYNGQQTGQHGIHGLWESRLPELFASHYLYWVGKAEYMTSPSDSVWKAVFESHDLVPMVLQEELLSSARISERKKYSIDYKNGIPVKSYSPLFCKEYHERLNGMVEQRLCKAIKFTADCWYTCWVNAGKPKLPVIDLSSEKRERRRNKATAEEHCIH